MTQFLSLSLPLSLSLVQATMLRKSKMKRRNTEPVLTASMDRVGQVPEKGPIMEKPEPSPE